MSFENQFIAKQLSNNDLITRLGKLVQSERKIMHLILECIAEIDARKLYLEKAYPSLYEFLIKEFGYSPSAAMRRIESARLLKEVPEVSQKIESGALNLSQLSQLQQAARLVQKTEQRKVEPSEKRELLRKLENATQANTELILAQELCLPVIVKNKATQHRDESVTLTVTFSKEQMALLEQAQDLTAHAVPEKKWSELIAYLAQKEVQRRTVIKKRNAAASVTDVKVSDQDSQDLVIENKLHKFIRKSIRPNLRKSIFQEQPCCQYKDPESGKICGSTRFLQIDHIQSVSAGGGNGRENLQILCAQHNRFKFNTENPTSF
ncbi:HNH endonuclease [bacterium]|nr:HNH endonuclease [bacterium]